MATGADVNAQSNNGGTALDAAEKWRFPEVISVLKAAGD